MRVFQFIFILMMTASNAFASALVKKDDANQILQVISQFNFRGAAMTDENAVASALEISKMWNESKATIELDGTEYKVEFVISYNLEPAKLWASSCSENYIQILDKAVPGDRSFFTESGRSGILYTADDLGNSSTVAHEFGHGIGLDHNPLNQVDADVPGIMFARGTLVASEFQWDPDAPSGVGARGGTLNPSYRHVRAEDVAEIKFSKLKFNDEGFACIGPGNPIPALYKNVIQDDGFDESYVQDPVPNLVSPTVVQIPEPTQAPDKVESAAPATSTSSK